MCFREKLVQTAFQSLQLVVTDYLPIIPRCYLEVVVGVAAKFGVQKQELNVSLTAIGLLVSVVFCMIFFSPPNIKMLMKYNLNLAMASANMFMKY